MSSPFAEDDGPQPPKVLKTPLEVCASLRMLEQNHDALVVTFEGRSQRFQSYLVHLDRERGRLALDEMFPTDAERLLNSGAAFHVEGYHEGVRIAWECTQVKAGEHEGSRCFWTPIPSEITYHQRRNAFRASIKHGLAINVELSGKHLRLPVRGQMLDISATGCRLRFPGNLGDRLQTGQVYECLHFATPFGKLNVAIELRHLDFQLKVNTTFAGVRFHQVGGLDQRHIERFVYQLQREARRTGLDD